MASRYTLERDCKRRNAARNVTETKAIDAFDFCNNTKGNFLITGGEADKRASLILEYISARSYGCPVVILSSSDVLEKKLIDNLAHIGKTMTVISSRYKTYSCFFGMDDVEITKNLIETAQYLNLRNIESLFTFSEAFLKLLRKCGHIPELNSMRALIRNDINILCNVAVQKSLDASDIDILKREKEGADIMKFVLGVIESAFKNVHSIRIDKRNSLIALSGKRDIVFISAKSEEQTVMNNILASEIRHLIGKRLLVIFDEIPLANSMKLRDTIENMRSKSNTDIGLSLVNANTWLGNDEEAYDKNSMIILPIQLGHKDIDKLTDSFGTYMYHYVDVDIPMEFGKLIHDKHFVIKAEERKRVRISDLDNIGAILSGHNGKQILLARNITSKFEEGGLTNGGLRCISKL